MIPTDTLLQETTYLDFTHPVLQSLAGTLDTGTYAAQVFEFVRDEIPHTSTTDRQILTWRASDVLLERTGICHAKANLLAALLRVHGIPAGFGYQRLKRADDDSEGYLLHGFVLAYLDGRWVPLDPRPGVEFSWEDPHLAFPCRSQFDEYLYPGIWANPDQATMDVLETSASLDEAIAHLPDQPCHMEDIALNNILEPALRTSE